MTMRMTALTTMKKDDDDGDNDHEPARPLCGRDGPATTLRRHARACAHTHGETAAAAKTGGTARCSRSFDSNYLARQPSQFRILPESRSINSLLKLEAVLQTDIQIRYCVCM